LGLGYIRVIVPTHLTLSLDERRALHTGRLEALDRHLRSHPDDAEAGAVRTAVLAARPGGLRADARGLLRELDLSLASAPLSGDARYNRGIVRHFLGDNRGALADFEAAAELNTSDGQAHYNRAAVLCELGEPSAALDAYTAAVAVPKYFAPTQPQRKRDTKEYAFWGRGRLLASMGRHDEAIGDFDSAVRPDSRLLIDSGFPLQCGPLAGVLADRGISKARMGDFAGALEDFRAFVDTSLGGEWRTSCDHRCIGAYGDEERAVALEGVLATETLFVGTRWEEAFELFKRRLPRWQG
jgi:tetratricopeptide (TPR) repeat protein